MWLDLIAQANEIFARFNEFAKASPVVAGIVGLWGAGFITFFLRGVPSRIWSFVKRQTTTTLIINNRDSIYYDFLKWTTKNNFNSFVRNLNFNNNNKDYGEASITIGYGFSFFFFKRRIFFMYRSKEEASQTTAVKETIELDVLGRNHNIFKELFNEILNLEEEEDKYLKIKYWRGSYWDSGPEVFKRSIDSVIIDRQVKKRLINHIENFLSKKQWYVDNGLPYRDALLFPGPPGTGKTSLVKALCSYFKRDLYILNLGGMSDATLIEALSDVPMNAFIVIEDIDTFSVVKARKRKKPNKKLKNLKEVLKNDELEDDNESASFLSLSGLLNAIDGPASGDNRIIMATTNHPDKLDPALIREGRFGSRNTFELGYMSKEMLQEFFDRFYPGTKIPKNFKLKDKVPPCDIQRLVFDNRNNPKQVLKELSK